MQLFPSIFTLKIGLLITYTRKIFNLLLKESRYKRIIGQSANILFVSILIDRNLIVQVKNEIILSKNTPDLEAVINDEFSRLFTDRNIVFTLDRQNRWKFQENVESFVSKLKVILYQ